ncbi:MAG: DEAD/DEAH box helicase [Pseudomonadales bacterium]|nr:DEAD/DEAH box helicase [Pseudomonadales bacterium]MCP5184095.1 DEAD/DEAH box helicase [Pseudomonadales bacterium]
MSFPSLGLQDSLLRAIADTGYTQPTPIQSRAIPAILAGGDIMAAAQTGTGKTAGFTLPILQRLGRGARVRARHIRALILTPTRELAAQIRQSIETYGRYEKLSSLVVFGGVNINPQQAALRNGVDILVATPGRLLDLYQQQAIRFDDLEVLVLDEADRMLDMGFIHDIRRILKLLPARRQNLMFSATFSDEIRQLAKGICHQPEEIDVAPRNATVDAITQHIYPVPKESKVAVLTSLLRATSDQALVFSRTKHGADKLVRVLSKAGIGAVAIHGNKSQNQRTRALDDFKQDRTQVLVATDIAARGIDIDQLAQVINFDLPHVPEDYVHRIGRTGRAGADGLAMSLVAPEEEKQLRDIERLIRRRLDRVQPPEPAVLEGEIPDFSDRPRGQGRQSSPSRQRSQGAATAVRGNGHGQSRGRGNKPHAARTDGRTEDRQGSTNSGSGKQARGDASPRSSRDAQDAKPAPSAQSPRRRRRRRSTTGEAGSRDNSTMVVTPTSSGGRSARPSTSDSPFSRLKRLFASN